MAKCKVIWGERYWLITSLAKDFFSFCPGNGSLIPRALSVNKSGLLDKRLLVVFRKKFEIGDLMLTKWGLVVNNVVLLV